MVNAIIGKAESTVKIARSSKRCGKMLLTRITDRHATFRMIGRIAKRKKLPCVISPLDIKIQTEIEMSQESYRDMIFDPKYFISKGGQKSLDRAAFDVTCMLSEISSVAQFYIGR